MEEPERGNACPEGEEDAGVYDFVGESVGCCREKEFPDIDAERPDRRNDFLSS